MSCYIAGWAVPFFKRAPHSLSLSRSSWMNVLTRFLWASIWCIRLTGRVLFDLMEIHTARPCPHFFRQTLPAGWKRMKNSPSDHSGILFLVFPDWRVHVSLIFVACCWPTTAISSQWVYNNSAKLCSCAYHQVLFGPSQKSWTSGSSLAGNLPLGAYSTNSNWLVLKAIGALSSSKFQSFSTTQHWALHHRPTWPVRLLTMDGRGEREERV